MHIFARKVIRVESPLDKRDERATYEKAHSKRSTKHISEEPANASLPLPWRDAMRKSIRGAVLATPKRGLHEKDPNVSLKVGIQLLHVITMSLHFCASAMPFNISVLIDI